MCLTPFLNSCSRNRVGPWHRLQLYGFGSFCPIRLALGWGELTVKSDFSQNVSIIVLRFGVIKCQKSHMPRKASVSPALANFHVSRKSCPLSAEIRCLIFGRSNGYHLGCALVNVR